MPRSRFKSPDQRTRETRVQMAERRARETPQEKEMRRETVRRYMRERREAETVEESEWRRKSSRDYMKKKRERLKAAEEGSNDKNDNKKKMEGAVKNEQKKAQKQSVTRGRKKRVRTAEEDTSSPPASAADTKDSAWKQTHNGRHHGSEAGGVRVTEQGADQQVSSGAVEVKEAETQVEEVPEDYDGPICAALGCDKTTLTHPHYTFFKFPHNPQQCIGWIQRVAREDLIELLITKLGDQTYKTAFLCPEHFESSQFTDAKQDSLKWDAVPTKFLEPPQPGKKHQQSTSRSWVKQEVKREREEIKEEPLEHPSKPTGGGGGGGE